MNSYDGWLKNCAENDLKIAKLEEIDDSKLLKTWYDYELYNNFYRSEPKYHVWIGNRWKIFANLNDAKDYFLRETSSL